ncbi:MAG: hypothetical protein HZB25_05255 [Candidatus Eisenbacteria bacterium]|nr:hypothetical protein [Candidatus Eisenbacteria bacterium]
MRHRLAALALGALLISGALPTLPAPAAAAPPPPAPAPAAAAPQARTPRAKVAPAAPVTYAGLAHDFARLRAEARALADEFRALQAAASSLSPAERRRRTADLDVRSRSLAARMEQLDARVAALPEGAPMIPNLAGLNADSLALALAREFEPVLRAFGRLANPFARNAGSGPEIPWVDWKAHLRVTPLPTVATRNFTRTAAPAAGIERVSLAHRFGDVRVVQSADESLRVAVSISVQGNMTEADARALADQVRLDLAMDTACAALASIPELRGESDRAIRVDLTLSVPRALGACVRNAYGDLIVSDVAGRVDGSVSFGDLLAHDLGSPARLEVRNGDLKAERARATLDAVDQFGVLLIREVTGALMVDGQNSEMHIEDARGGAQLTARNGSLRLRSAVGPIGLSAQNATVGVESVRGNITLNTQMARTEISQVAGTLNAQCFDGSLATSFVGQPQDLQTRYCTVRVENPGGDVKLSGESAPMLLRIPEGGAGRRYDAVNRFGTLTLEVPRAGSAAIQAATNFGTIYSDLPMRRADTGDWQRGEATIGGGEAQVTLQAVNSSIRITTAGR